MMLILLPPSAIFTGRTLSWFYNETKINGKTVMFTIFVLMLLHKSIYSPVKMILSKNIRESHQVRKELVQIARANPEHHIIVAEGRTKKMISLYDGFRKEIMVRMSQCSYKNTEDHSIIYIDWGRSEFLKSAYGSNTCAMELSDIAHTSSFQILHDSKRYLIAIR
jgi:hypothetical protein